MLKQKEVSIELKPTCAPEFMMIAKEMGMNPRFSKGCLAGTSYCIISPGGEVQICAIKVPLDRVPEVAILININSGVTHNYIRSYSYNM